MATRVSQELTEVGVDGAAAGVQVSQVVLEIGTADAAVTRVSQVVIEVGNILASGARQRRNPSALGTRTGTRGVQ